MCLTFLSHKFGLLPRSQCVCVAACLLTRFYPTLCQCNSQFCTLCIWGVHASACNCVCVHEKEKVRDEEVQFVLYD